MARDMAATGSDRDRLFQRANAEEEAGNLKSAFRLYLAAAKRGDSGCQVNLGNFYCDGIGVKRNRKRALYWYRRALRKGESCAASNIAVLYRDEQKIELALSWFERAVALGEPEANLEIAKIHLKRGHKTKAVQCLKRVRKAKPGVDVTVDGWEEAKRMLKRLTQLL
jgi:uncharacterized protein